MFAMGRTQLLENSGPPHLIHLLPDARLQAIHVQATVSLHFSDEIQRQLDNDVDKGNIEAVPAGKPTEWCSRMALVPKQDGRLHRMVDFQRFSRVSLGDIHHTRPPSDLVSSVPKQAFKAVADAYSGNHQVPIHEESGKFTTFITPWGRYRYCRTPMGHCASQNAF